MPPIRMTRSTAAPIPSNGGMVSCPVTNEAMPVTVSARTKGKDTTMNAFKTAVFPSPPFHGLLFEDQIPTTAKMTAKMRATIGL
jgi:hypothetical protein